jgi:outer membrane protein assembly factor BamE (lipoprotein component of BamABCDE complex)
VTALVQIHRLRGTTAAAVLAVSSACLLLSGCSIIRQDVGQALVIDKEVLANAHDYRQVLRMLGPPHKLSKTDGGMTFLYEEVDLLERQVGLNLGVGDKVLLKAVAAREYADLRTLVLTFDAQGKTQSFNYREWSDIAAQGAALQFVFVVASVADEGDLNDSPSNHHWGFGLLKANLPRALNRPSSLETGENGVELKGTPTNIGQHALELR